MKEQEIIEGNKLIAEYIGFVKHFPNMNKESDLSNFYYYPYIDKVFDEGNYTSAVKMTSQEGIYHNICIRESNHLKDLPFYKSWGLLVPVVQKIFEERELSSGEILQLADVNLAWSRKDITEIWKSVVKYIQWLNERV
jgi:hypothetical protein